MGQARSSGKFQERAQAAIARREAADAQRVRAAEDAESKALYDALPVEEQKEIVHMARRYALRRCRQMELIEMAAGFAAETLMPKSQLERAALGKYDTLAAFS